MWQHIRLRRSPSTHDDIDKARARQRLIGRRVSWGHDDADTRLNITMQAPSEVSRRAFSRVDALVIIVVVVVAAFMLIPTQPRRPRIARQLKDSIHIRAIMQSLIIWGENNNNRFPLPSDYDLNDQTVVDRGVRKNTTANTLSMLIFNSAIFPELCVSPAEVSEYVDQQRDYAFSAPPTAAMPSEALWDPSFRATPMDPVRVLGVGVPSPDNATPRPSNQSYAFTLPIGKRMDLWQNTFSASTPILGNRGPTYAKDDSAPRPPDGRWTLLEGELGTQSRTLRIHGGRNTWEGHIAYADGHVTFQSTPTPPEVTYRDAKSAKPVGDNLFVNESGEYEGDTSPGTFDRGQNAYLRAVHRLTADGKASVWRD